MEVKKKVARPVPHYRRLIIGRGAKPREAELFERRNF